jgi:predicted phosphoribosyltransferase
MVVHRTAIFQNRKHAAIHLGERLMEYKGGDALMLAVLGGGIHIGAYLAGLLNLPLDVIPCKKLKHPADDNKTIGAICSDSVILHEQNNDIPQDFIYHQIQLLKHVVEGQNKNYRRGQTLEELIRNQTIILVDDVLISGDSMLASLQTIRKYKPREVVVAVPIVTPEGARAIADETDKLVYLTIEPQSSGRFYEEFPAVSNEEVVEVLNHFRSTPYRKNKH